MRRSYFRYYVFFYTSKHELHRFGFHTEEDALRWANDPINRPSVIAVKDIQKQITVD